MGELEFGICDVCGKEGILRRKYYYYDLYCDCHIGEHFELVKYCGECKPKPPLQTVVEVKPIEEVDG